MLLLASNMTTMTQPQYFLSYLPLPNKPIPSHNTECPLRAWPQEGWSQQANCQWQNTEGGLRGKGQGSVLKNTQLFSYAHADLSQRGVLKVWYTRGRVEYHSRQKSFPRFLPEPLALIPHLRLTQQDNLIITGHITTDRQTDMNISSTKESLTSSIRV